MANPYFRFKQFVVFHDRCAMKVTTDACLFGAWCADQLLNTENVRILDIGTGTGLLSFMVAQKSHGKIDAIEIDAAAAQQAEVNNRSTPWKDRIHIQHLSIQLLPSNNYDFIISNPPFYEHEIKSSAKLKNVAHHSDELSLKDLFSIIDDKLNTNGSCFLLLPYKRRYEIELLIKKRSFYISESVIVKQSYKHEPFRWMIRLGMQYSDIKETTISIWNDQQQYTPEFIHLLKDYYLYL